MQHILVAGATGTLGRHVVDVLKRRGYRVRALSRRPEKTLPGVDEVFNGDVCNPASLLGACDGVDAVFSAAGASLALKLMPRSGSFSEVDYVGNVNLLREAVEAGVQRFAYVSVYSPPTLAGLEYVQAHEAFVEELRRSGLAHSVVRPTGFFSALRVLTDVARLGVAPLVGDGAARTNPIHEADVAEVCVEAIAGEPMDRDVGGPDVLSRREMCELAFEAVGKKPRFVRLPPWVIDANGQAVAPLDARLTALLAFFKDVSRHDVVAPAAGRRRLAAYFRETIGQERVTGK